MASRIIKVTPEELENTATAIADLADDYKELYGNFYSETDAMEKSWKGEDNLAFIRQIAEFKDDFNKMYSLMMEYVRFLRKSAKAYRDTQGDVVREARKLVTNG